MNQLFVCLLTLLFSLSGPTMGEYSDLGRSSFAANTEASLAQRIMSAERTGSGLKADASHRAASFIGGST